MMQESSPVIEQVKRLRAAQSAREAKELQRLVEAFAGINKAATNEAEALALKIFTEFEATGKAPTEAQILKLSRYRDLIATVNEELEQYQAFMRVELRSQSMLAITEGERAARVLAQLAARDVGLSAQFRAINPAVIEQLVGFLDPRGPLYKRLGLLSGWTADQVAAKIIEGVGLGLNPKTTARMLTKRLMGETTNAVGMALTDSLRMMRTAQLWSYREANRASYVANSDVVRGWVWYAELGNSTTCASCIAMHGTEHPLDEPLRDHHNGKCAALPLVISGANPVSQSGLQYFDSLNEEQQKTILGASKWSAWREGKFQFADVSGEQVDEVYGRMRSERSLKDLLGEG